MSPALASSRLAALAQRSVAEQAAAAERCELCSAPLAAEHRHIYDLQAREVMCACRACSLLLDSGAAGGGHFRLIGDRRLCITDFALDDVMWAELRLPVDIAFFFHRSDEDRVAACYPSPMGATESLLVLSAWTDLEAANPVLRTLEPDVEALLVDRAHGARRHWLVPIDDCFRLVGLIRARWRGLTGGKEVWAEVGRFFDELDRRSRPVGRETT